jgi:hypothetical protein
LKDLQIQVKKPEDNKDENISLYSPQKMKLGLFCVDHKSDEI